MKIIIICIFLLSWFLAYMQFVSTEKLLYYYTELEIMFLLDTLNMNSI